MINKPMQTMKSFYAAMTEEEWRQKVVDIAKLGQWTLRYHTRRSKGSDRGFLDQVFIRDAVLLFAEVKREDGTATPEQRDWLAGLARVSEGAGPFAQGGLVAMPDRHVQVYLWRPSDIDQVERVLLGPRILR